MHKLGRLNATLSVALVLTSSLAFYGFFSLSRSLDGATATASYIISHDLTGQRYQAYNGTTGQMDYSSTSASYVLNSAITALGSAGGLIFIKTGEYNIDSSIIVHGGIRLEGEGINKYANESGTKLQLTANIPLILMNSTNNQYFFSIADMELYGNGYSSYTIQTGDVVTNSSCAIMLTGSFSDYLIENMFIHGFGVCIYADSSGWYGRVSKCWLEGSGIGIVLKHKQFIVSDSSISGDTYAMYMEAFARDVICSNNHIYSCTNGVYIDMRTAGNRDFIFGDSQFTDCQLGSFIIYDYTGCYLNISISDCEMGQRDYATQRYAITTWTSGSGDITLQVDNSKFFPVTTSYLTSLAGSTNNTHYLFGETNTGFVTENLVFNVENTTATTFVFNHGLAAAANSVLCTFNVTGLTYTWSSTTTQVTVTVAPVSGNLADLPATMKILAADVRYTP